MTIARHPYLDAALDPAKRADDLLDRLSLDDKVGLLFHTVATPGDPDEPNPVLPIASVRSLIEKGITHFNILGAAGTGREFAEWTNAVQRIALGRPAGIPVTFSTDPRHHFSDNPMTSMVAGPFSQWPETLGLAAIGSPETVHHFADISRQEYLAVGIRLALHPQVDLATEPRWSRINGTFGEDAELTARLVVPYIRGFQGPTLGVDSVATMTKHFPGGGPQRDGLDPHFDFGREQVYPGNNFDYHLMPFKAAIAAGTSQMMPYYGMPIDTDLEEVGFSFNKSIVTTLLREQLGFDGIICTDWNLVSENAAATAMGMPTKAWGVEHLSQEERVLRLIDAGVDQLGGEDCTDILRDLVRAGQVTEDRIDRSARRLLREKFRLGLFDKAYVDVDRASRVVGNLEFVQAGLRAQRDSVTVLTNSDGDTGPTLPMSEGIKVYAEGINPAVLSNYAQIVDDPALADIAMLRIQAPFDPSIGFGMAALFHHGSLEFGEDAIDHIRSVSSTTPIVLDIYLDRPAVVTPFVDQTVALVATFGVSDVAFLDVMFGRHTPLGRLPFDLPRSNAAVSASRSDVPFDTVDPVFSFGHGLSYGD